MFKKLQSALSITTLLFLSTLCFTGTTLAAGVTWPAQPAFGPGGTDYAYDYVCTPESHGYGDTKYTIYEPCLSPTERVPAHEALPVLAFLHGWQSNPGNLLPYARFIEHLVKKGFIVIYPQYQNLFTIPNRYVVNAGNALAGALDYIAAHPTDHVQPRITAGEIQMGVIGHSYGGITAANIAVKYGDYGLPRPRALMMLMATSGTTRNRVTYWWETTPLDPDTDLVVVAGDKDTLAKDEGGGSVWNHASQIDNSRKSWILLKSDTYGGLKAMLADHLSPCSANATQLGMRSVLNAFDYNGFWKWATALMNDAFYGVDGNWVFGNTHKQRDMGQWSDGQPVTEPEVSLSPEWHS